jgi:hypothetical protein
LHAAVLLVKTQPPAGLHVSVVQGLLSLQTSGAEPGWQLPPAQVSPVVQALPSSQAIVLLVNTQPTAGSHVSVVHGLLSLQVSVPAPGWQLPPAQVSPGVHAFPPSQAIVLLVNTHPEPGSHVSVVHTFASSQTIAVPVHEPPPHVSLAVHAFPSSQAFVLLVKTHPEPGLHVSVVHAFPSSHTIAAPAHTPPPHVSPTVHAFPSLHRIVLLV